jgi:hypothetical protein
MNSKQEGPEPKLGRGKLAQAAQKPTKVTEALARCGFVPKNLQGSSCRCLLRNYKNDKCGCSSKCSSEALKKAIVEMSTSATSKKI